MSFHPARWHRKDGTPWLHHWLFLIHIPNVRLLGDHDLTMTSLDRSIHRASTSMASSWKVLDGKMEKAKMRPLGAGNGRSGRHDIMTWQGSGFFSGIHGEKYLCGILWVYLDIPIGSMYVCHINGNIYHQYTPVMLPYIPYDWMKNDQLDEYRGTVGIMGIRSESWW